MFIIFQTGAKAMPRAVGRPQQDAQMTKAQNDLRLGLERVVSADCLPPAAAQDRPQHSAQYLLADFPADRAGDTARRTLGGGLQHAFALAATGAGAAHQDVTEAAEQAAAGFGLRGRFGLAGRGGGFVARLRLAAVVAPVVGIEAAGRRGGDGAGSGLLGGGLAA